MKLKLLGCFLLLILCAAATAGAQSTKLAERISRYEPYLAASAARHGVDARLLWVIAWLETRFNPAAVSRKGARGLMQMTPATARRFGLQNPHEPGAAIDAAARYVRLLTVRYGGRTDLVLAAYNAGEAAVDAYLTGRTIQAGNKVINAGRRTTGGVPPYRETREYVANGLRLLNGQFSLAATIARTRRRAQESPASIEKEAQPPVRKSVLYAAAPEQDGEVSSAKVRRSTSW